MTEKDAATPATAEIITPLKVSGKKRRGDEDLAPAYRRCRIVLICAMVGLVAGGFWLLDYLSKNQVSPSAVANTKPSGHSKPEEIDAAPAAEPPQPADPARLAADKAAAERKLAEFLEAKKNLDRTGASVWGAAAYAEMDGLAQEADTHFMHEEYASAAGRYDQATAIASQLNDRTAEALQQLLVEGRNALDQGRGTQAQDKFRIALMIDPANAPAHKGLKRAGTIEEIIQLIDSGGKHEADGQLSAAQADYRKALSIDPDSEKAQQALSRVTVRANDQQYQQLMSQGLTALHQKDYQRAGAALLKARALKPDSSEAADALLQVDQAQRLARIDRLREKARIADQSEQWQQALEAYLAVLDIDKNIQFAARGRDRAQERIRLAKRLNYYIAQPRALESDQQLDKAALLLSEAKTTEPQGPRLAAQIKELEKLVAAFRMPADVLIESDNMTQVAVYKVGRLGRFEQHELKLRPGTYTVVGARDGYKDVRREIVVTPGQASLRLTIECRDKI
jgi:Flp pilus assembly protein TadD